MVRPERFLVDDEGAAVERFCARIVSSLSGEHCQEAQIRAHILVRGPERFLAEWELATAERLGPPPIRAGRAAPLPRTLPRPARVTRGCSLTRPRSPTRPRLGSAQAASREWPAPGGRAAPPPDIRPGSGGARQGC